VVNHALLLSDVATGSRVLPEYDYVIVDEAHHMEAATTNALSFRVTQLDVARLLREMGGSSSGIFGRLLGQIGSLLRPSEMAAMNQSIDRATTLIFRLEQTYISFFRAMEEFLAEIREGRPISAYGQQERILDSSRTLPPWTNVEIAWDAAHEVTTLLANLTAEIYKTCTDYRDNADEEFNDTIE